jgi:hypothetical protein
MVVVWHGGARGAVRHTSDGPSDGPSLIANVKRVQRGVLVGVDECCGTSALWGVSTRTTKWSP